MATFYFVGFILSLLAMACLDARGCKAIDVRPQRQAGDREELIVLTLLACLVWPLTISVLTVASVYFLLVHAFGRCVKEWRCPAVEKSMFDS